jgi:glyoxylate reductase
MELLLAEGGEAVGHEDGDVVEAVPSRVATGQRHGPFVDVREHDLSGADEDGRHEAHRAPPCAQVQHPLPRAEGHCLQEETGPRVEPSSGEHPAVRLDLERYATHRDREPNRFVSETRTGAEVVLRAPAHRRDLPMYRVVSTSPLFPDVLAAFRDRLDLVIAPLSDRRALEEADGLVTLLTDRVTPEVLAGTPIRVVSNVAVGYDNIDVQALRGTGILVCHTPDVLTDATADLTLLLILALLRGLLPATADLRAGRWQGWALDDHLGRHLGGKVLGIVGLGRIGKAVAERAEAFALDVRYWSPSGPKADVPWPWRPLPDLLAEADIVSLHLPLSPQSRHLFDAETFSRMRAGAWFVNTARGGLVDESALVAALTSGHLAGAALDVFAVEPLPMTSPLLALPNVVLAPHIGSATLETRQEMARLALENAFAALSGRPQNVVPELATDDT